MHSDDAYVPGFGRWMAALILFLVAISIYLPGTDLPGNGLQWSTEYHEQ